MKSGDRCARGIDRAGLYETKLSETQIAKVALQVYAAERKHMTELADPETNVEMIHESWRKLCDALTVKSPRLRYPVGQAVALSRLRRFVPAGMFDRSLRKQFQLD
jgi:hypothetical protein